jgi:hypothetical protein
MALGAGTAFAATTHNSGDKVESDTVQLNWTGNGAPVDQQCGAQADPGHLGYENGATADNYMLWIFNTDGGGTTGPVTITINGVTYSDSNDGHQIVTPYIDPATINHSDADGYNAYTNFVVDTTGNGSWILTISHGCGTVADIPYAPAGHIEGPCADPAYYAVFDNTATDPSITTKFRFRWYNNNGLNTAVKLVPGGDTYTTYQHWAKPGTYVSVWYKDNTTGAWVRLERELVVKGSYPACIYQPGWTRGGTV